MVKARSRFVVDWRTIFFLWGLQGCVAFVWLILLPADVDRKGVLGFSVARLLLLGSVAFVTSGSFLLFSKTNSISMRSKWLNLDKKPLVWDLIYLSSIVGSCVAPLVILILYILPGNTAYVSYAERLSPLAFWITASGLELAFFLAYARRTEVEDIHQQRKATVRITAYIMLFFLLAGVVIGITKIGITPILNWGGPAVPFFEWQILLVLLLLTFLAFLPQKILGVREKWIVAGVYVITLALWLSQPVNPAYFATPPRAPNYEIYPFTDALVYAQSAQAALVGNGFLYPEIPARSFYVACLTWFHVLAGQDYNNVIFLQTLVLAFFPVLLYLIGREFGGRPVGIGLALLAVFRDINVNHSALFAYNITYTKLFFSEIPTALLICVATLLCLRWVRPMKQPAWLPLLTGGILGVATLVRSQSMILMAVIALASFFVLPVFKQWLVKTGCLVAGFLVVLSPWLVRNYVATGGFVLDNPFTQTMTLTRRWTGSEGNEILPRLPRESDAEYSNRMMGEAISILKNNPGFILQTAASHFVNNEINSLLAFPIRDRLTSIRELFLPDRVFWKTPLVSWQVPLFGFNLLIFSIGLVAACQRHGLPGLLPLGFGLMYNAWSALFFTSGDRFIVPLDWSIHLYQVFGLLIIGSMILLHTHGAGKNIARWLRSLMTQPEQTPGTDLPSRRLYLTIILLLFLGLFLPLTEIVFPKRYPPRAQDEIARQIGISLESGEQALYGRALYPRYYEAGDGEPETSKTGYAPDENARMVFYMVGSANTLVVFETADLPEFFPHTSDVILIGTYKDLYFSPRVVGVFQDSQSEIYFNQ